MLARFAERLSRIEPFLAMEVMERTFAMDLREGLDRLARVLPGLR